MYLIKPSRDEHFEGLAASWGQIGELLDELKYQLYSDDQWEIEEIWKICNALLMTNKLEQEDWELRKIFCPILFCTIIIVNTAAMTQCLICRINCV